MVFEAATQMVETAGLEAGTVESYDIRNVSLSRALMVPEDDFGIETLLTLRQTPLNATSRHQWLFDFVLTSVANEEGVDTFTEHCRGQVAIDFEQYGKHLPLQLLCVHPGTDSLSNARGRRDEKCPFIFFQENHKCWAVV
jgi:hypothetical protein